MSNTSHSSASLARVPFAYWLILTPALTAFAVISGQLLFAGLLAASALFCKLAASRLLASFPRLAMLPEWLLVTLAYAYALPPFWPGALSDHLWTPQAAIAVTAGLAASMRQRLGMGRPLASMAMIALLLLVRNLVTLFEFTIPLLDIIRSIALVSIVEIARSRRYRVSNGDLSIEFGLALLLALFASFTLNSIVLSVFLGALPVAGYLLRNHEISQPRPSLRNEVQETIPRSRSLYEKEHRRSLVASGFAFSFVALLIGCSVYFVLLKLPFWPDHTEDAPYFARSLANDAIEISEAAQLDTQQLREYVRSTPNPKWIAGRRDAFRDAVASLVDEIRTIKPDTPSDAPEPRAPSPGKPPPALRPQQLPSFTQTELKRSERQAAARHSNRVEGPKPRNRSSEMAAPATSDPAVSEGNAKRGAQIGFPSTEAKTRPSISEISDSYFSYDGSHVSPKQPEELQREAPEQQPDEFVSTSSSPTRSSSSLAQKIKESLGLDDSLDQYAEAEPMLADGLDVTPPSVASLLNQNPVLTVKLDSSRRGPERLYLRSNSLDTLTKTGFVAIRAEQHAVLLRTSEPNPGLDAFQTSSRRLHAVTITAQADRFGTLPLPESFSSIEFRGVETLIAYPNERIIDAPQTSAPLTYRMNGVDFETVASEPLPSHTTSEYKDRYLDIPLASPQKTYLKKLADRIGGRSQRNDRFADRVADYFARRHPYSFSVDIPEGPEHPVVRWLKGKEAGLCTNYASAFTLLARSRGIPTRVATGYATSEYDAKANRYTVRQRDAHAWVEYLDESETWVRFDPTPPISAEELARVAPLATKDDPSAFDELVNQEQRNLAAMRPTDFTASVLPTKPEYTDPLASMDKTQREAEPTLIALEHDFPNEGAADESRTTEASSETAPATVIASSDFDTVPSQPETPKPLSMPPQPIEAPATALDAQKPPETIATSTVAPPADATETLSAASRHPRYVPWIVALTLLALLLPLARLTTRASASWTSSPEIRLREQAGQLLSKVERLTENYHLTMHPAWRDLHQSLIAQRYGPQADKLQLKASVDRLSMLVRELSNSHQ